MNRYKLSKAGIDVNDGIHRFNDNKELYEHFLFSFPEDEHYENMLAAIQAGNVEECFQQAHALKGIAGTVSLNQLHTNIIPLVEEFRAGKLDQVEKLLPPVKEAYEAAVAVINEQKAEE